MTATNGQRMRRNVLKKLTEAKERSEYIAFILAQPCIVCEVHKKHSAERAEPWEQTTRTEGAHIGPSGRATEGNSGAGKGPFRRILPLCNRHHDGSMYSLHKLGKNFWMLHALDPEQLIQDFNSRLDAGDRAVA